MNTSILQRIHTARAKLDSIKPKVFGKVCRFGGENFTFTDDATAKAFAGEIIEALAPIVNSYKQRSEDILRDALDTGDTDEGAFEVHRIITESLFA